MKKILIFAVIIILVFIGFRIFNMRNNGNQSTTPPNCKIGYGYSRSFTGAGYVYSSCKRLSDDNGKTCYQASDCQNGCEADLSEVRNMCPNFDKDNSCPGISGKCIGIPGGSRSNTFIQEKGVVYIQFEF